MPAPDERMRARLASSPSPLGLLGLLGLFGPLGLLACSSTAAPASGSEGGVLDAGIRVFDATPPETGGGTSSCPDDGHPGTCLSASEAGAVAVGETLLLEGSLPNLLDEDWFVVDFPVADGVVDPALLGQPSVRLIGDATMEMEVHPGCAQPMHCDEGQLFAMTEWTFSDFDAEFGIYAARSVPWPERLYIGVHRRAGPASCDGYQLEISR